jgi:hypothetical protein
VSPRRGRPGSSSLGLLTEPFLPRGLRLGGLDLGRRAQQSADDVVELQDVGVDRGLERSDALPEGRGGRPSNSMPPTGPAMAFAADPRKSA